MPGRSKPSEQRYFTLGNLVSAYVALSNREGTVAALDAEVRSAARLVDLGMLVSVDLNAEHTKGATLMFMFTTIARELPDRALELNSILAACRF